MASASLPSFETYAHLGVPLFVGMDGATRESAQVLWGCLSKRRLMCLLEKMIYATWNEYNSDVKALAVCSMEDE